MRNLKDPNVKGRKYNGSPYLKLKRVGRPPRGENRQRLRCAVALGIGQPADMVAS